MTPALFTIDVEDWFHAGVMQPYVRRDGNSPMHRLSDNLQWLAEFLAKINGKATFFALSSLDPVVLRQLAALAKQGHEIASHGHSHTSLHLLSEKSLREELIRSRATLQEATASTVMGFRAPNFSITDIALKCMEETGYRYDSSLNNVRLHRGYGRLHEHTIMDEPYFIRPALQEFPLSTYPMMGWRLPVAGGAFLRHLPFALFKGAALHLANDGYYHFYLHPWEVDKKHPKVDRMKVLDRIRHYRNIHRVEDRLFELSEKLRFESIASRLNRQDS
jgi:polysaccharide deacetylase family protein (PEP-CTERM system associated)